MNRTRRMLFLVAFVFLAGLFLLLLPTGEVRGQGSGCSPWRAGPYDTGFSDACFGLADVTFYVHDALTGDSLGSANGGCWTCSHPRVVTFSKDGYESFSFTVNPSASRNGRQIHWDVFVCPILPTPTPTIPAEPILPPYVPDPHVPVYIYFNLDLENPVVVEQDPDRRGADIYLQLTVPAVVYDYEWEYYPGLWAKGRQVVTDYATTTSGLYLFRADLSDASRAWIEGELAARYPYAAVAHGHWDLTLTDDFEITADYLDGWGRHRVDMQALEVPFVDPGNYDVCGWFITEGTRFTPPAGLNIRDVTVDGISCQATGPRVFSSTAPLRVWMLDSFLME